MSEEFEQSGKESQAEPSSGNLSLLELMPLKLEEPSQRHESKSESTAAKDQVAFAQMKDDGKIEFTEKDFDKIGPKAAEVLRDAGVTKLTITPGKDSDHYEAELKAPLAIKQDPAVDGCRKLTIDTKFEADVKKLDDGTLVLENIKGLTAESKILLAWREAQVDKIQMKATPDGKAEVTSTGTWRGISRDQTREKPADVLEKANILFDRIEKMKAPAAATGKTSFLEIPRLSLA